MVFLALLDLFFSRKATRSFFPVLKGQKVRERRGKKVLIQRKHWKDLETDSKVSLFQSTMRSLGTKFCMAIYDAPRNFIWAQFFGTDIFLWLDSIMYWPWKKGCRVALKADLIRLKLRLGSFFMAERLLLLFFSLRACRASYNIESLSKKDFLFWQKKTLKVSRRRLAFRLVF